MPLGYRDPNQEYEFLENTFKDKYLKEGIKESMDKVAIRMANLGIENEIIVKVTGLSLDEINKLKQ